VIARDEPMISTITRRYRSFEDARNVVARLSGLGIPAERIGVVGRQQTGEDKTAAAAGIGGAAGAATGFMLSLGALTLPGVGPVVAAGWFLGGAVAGALAGGIAGALADAGVAGTDAEEHEQAVAAGSALVSVKANAAEIEPVTAIMDAAMPIQAATDDPTPVPS